jgi:hypothetical protein
VPRQFLQNARKDHQDEHRDEDASCDFKHCDGLLLLCSRLLRLKRCAAFALEAEANNRVIRVGDAIGLELDCIHVANKFSGDRICGVIQITFALLGNSQSVGENAASGAGLGHGYLLFVTHI